MPNLKCTVYNCNHNVDKLCALSSIDVTGGENVDNTCCASFSDSEGTKNYVGSAVRPETNITCAARDCTYNKECECHADSVEVCTCGAEACHCHDTACGTFNKK